MKDEMVQEIVVSQLTDPFRIGLLVALVVTMLRTAAVTGRVIPLLAGIVFVAVIVPMSLPSATVSRMDAILAGLVANVIILVPLLLAAALVARFRR